MITVLQHVTLHFGTGRVSVRESLIKIAISHGLIRARKPSLIWKRTKESGIK